MGCAHESWSWTGTSSRGTLEIYPNGRGSKLSTDIFRSRRYTTIDLLLDEYASLVLTLSEPPRSHPYISGLTNNKGVRSMEFNSLNEIK